MRFKLSSLQFINAQNGLIPDFGPSGSNPTSSVASIKDGVQFIQFLLPDSTRRFLNKLNGLGDLLLQENFEDAFTNISSYRYHMAEDIQDLINSPKLGATRDISIRTTLNKLGDLASDQHLQAMHLMYKVLTAAVRATLPLLATAPQTPVDYMLQTFVNLLEKCAECVNDYALAISGSFKSVADRSTAKTKTASIKYYIEQQVNIAADNSLNCMYPELIQAFKEIGVRQPQDLWAIIPKPGLTPVEAPYKNAVFAPIVAQQVPAAASLG